MAVKIKDVAEKAGVSTATVSRVLNDDPRITDATKAKVMEAVRQTGYRMNSVARSLRTAQTRIIGFLAPELVNDFFMTVAQGVEDELKESGYSLLVCNANEDPKEEARRIELLLETCIDGAILIPSSQSGKHFNRLAQMNVPTVLVDRLVDDFESDAVVVDNFQGVYDAMEFLIDGPFEAFGFIGGDLSISNFRERYEGFTKALDDHGIPCNPDFIRMGDSHVDSGYALMQELMNQPQRPSHVFIANYYMHVGAVKYLASHGFGSWLQAPGEEAPASQPIHIASFDDMTLSPILGFSDLTVAQPMHEIGREAARLVLERIAGESEGEGFRILRLPTRLKPRENR